MGWAALTARSSGTLFAMLLLASPALAQAVPMRMVGTISSMNGTMLTLKTLGGDDVAITVPDPTRVTALVNRKLADIKAGDFVGSAAVLGKDGHLHAQEVHIFPEAMRGSGEGHRPMAGIDQTMTNAAVAGLATAPDGEVLTLKYPGGQQEIEVGPEARIVAFIPGDRSLLKPGAMVAVSATKGADGSLTATSIQAEKDGVKPLVY